MALLAFSGLGTTANSSLQTADSFVIVIGAGGADKRILVSEVDKRYAPLLAAASGNKVFATPANGSSGAYAGRALVAADIPVNIIAESKLLLADNTTGNASTSQHGFVPKLPNDATKYYDGTGVYSVPAVAWGAITGTLSDQTDLQTAIAAAGAPQLPQYNKGADSVNQNSLIDGQVSPNSSAFAAMTDIAISFNALGGIAVTVSQLPPGSFLIFTSATGVTVVLQITSVGMAGSTGIQLNVSPINTGTWTNGNYTLSVIPGAQVQADWNEADNTQPDYIKNKPTLGQALADDTGWTANADNGDKTAVIPSDASIATIATALDPTNVTGIGALLTQLADKLKALEYALSINKLPNA
jgi:hypothetical protein